MKIYLAGKIDYNDWRHSIVDGLGEASFYPKEWPVLKESIFATHDYVGPFFLSLGHGQSHGDDYAHGTEVSNHCSGGEEIVEQCFQAIELCDIFFAYIEARDCFGTFCEIGYARSRGKRVVVCYAPKVDDSDLWFLNFCASVVKKNVSDPEEELRKMCPQKLPKRVERFYKSKVPFSNPMEIDWRLMPDGRERRQAYYCSSEWEGLRQQVIARCFGYCELCKSEPVYLVHHLTYARLYKEHLNDLQGLCEKCHQSIHHSRSGVSSNGN